jgi:hypothetical protein
MELQRSVDRDQIIELVRLERYLRDQASWSERALTESYGEIHNRSTIDGVEVDMIQYCRFVSRVVRTERGWLLASFDGIYGKDQIWTVDPSRDLPFDWSELQGLRPSYRIWAYTLSLKGYDVGADELGDDRPDLLEAFFADAESWLAVRELVA